jgi:hypothetical protein
VPASAYPDFFGARRRADFAGCTHRAGRRGAKPPAPRSRRTSLARPRSRLPRRPSPRSRHVAADVPPCLFTSAAEVVPTASNRRYFADLLRSTQRADHDRTGRVADFGTNLCHAHARHRSTVSVLTLTSSLPTACVP